MQGHSIFLDYKKSKVHLLRFGSGKDLLISFPGYANPAEIFLPLATALGEHYTILSVDLPFHGATEWSASSFSLEDMHGLIELILLREGRSEFALMGYSFGGRIVQKLVPNFASKIKTIILLAPDGIFTRGMVNAHLVPRFVRGWLRRSLRDPGWLLSLVRLFHRLQLLSDYNLKFIHYHMSNAERRERLFNTWVSMYDFVLRPAKTKELFRKSKIPVALFFGKTDPAIPLESGKWMAQDLENVSLFILEEGHRIIGPALIKALREYQKKADPD